MRTSDRPDIGQGGPWELFDRYPLTFGVLGAVLLLYTFAIKQGGTLTVDPEVQLHLGANAYWLAREEPWRLVTSAFLHYDPLHLLLNGVGIYLLGRILEVHFGSSRLGVLYVGFALAGSLASAGWNGLRAGAGAFAQGGAPVSAGASGALCGLLLLGFVYARSVPERLGSLAQSLQRWIIIAILFSFLFPGVDAAGHVGGALAGIAAGLFVRPRPGETVSLGWTLGGVAAALLCLACFGIVLTGARPLG